MSMLWVVLAYFVIGILVSMVCMVLSQRQMRTDDEVFLMFTSIAALFIWPMVLLAGGFLSMWYGLFKLAELINSYIDKRWGQ